MRSHRRVGNAALVVALAAVTGTLGACSAPGETAGTAASASASPLREAGLYRDTRVCVENASSRTITVTFPTKDSSSGEGEVPAGGGPACASGWSSSSALDVQAVVTTSQPDGYFEMDANNPRVGSPTLYGSTMPDGRICFGKGIGWSVGDVDDFDTGYVHLRTARNADSPDAIEFRVTVSDSTTPPADGKPITCEHRRSN